MPGEFEKLKAILATYPEAVARSKPKPNPKKAAAENSARKAAADSSPIIKNQPLRIITETKAAEPHGVVLAQGGREHGYAVHFIDGKPAFDLRVNGKVSRLVGAKRLGGETRLEVNVNAVQITLAADGKEVAKSRSPGLIPVQPRDALTVGQDLLSAAGDYEAPNPFNGTIRNTRVEAGGKPAAVAEVKEHPEIEAGLSNHDRAVFVHNSWIRDPYIVRGKDNLYYLTGTTPNTNDPREATDPYNSGLGMESLVGSQANVWRSRDLADWELIDTPFTLKDGIWFTADPQAFASTPEQQWRLWAPELHWLEKQNRWALVHTSPSPVKGANLALSAGAEVGGPWTHPMGEKIGRRHDPSLFKDDDGQWWMIWGATTIAPLTADFSSFTQKPTDIHPAPSSDRATAGLTMGHEGCLIMKIEGKYVLFGTGWSTGKMRRGSYNLYYATADQITGPYSERKFAGRFLGHGTPFQDGDGRWWCTAFYNANVPPDPRDGIESRDLGDTARTINQRGTTLVPLDVRLVHDGQLLIRAKDPAYATPGPDEAQVFDD